MEGLLVKRRVVFFNNLILLGLDCAYFEKKSGISFHKDMFVLPNKKGFEVVTHFLFSKLSAVTQTDYKLPWPLITKEQDRIFQKTCYAHLSNFAQENSVKFPSIIPSLLSKFGGDRFYEVYLAFSSYILIETVKKGGVNILSRPSVIKDNFTIAENVLQLSTIARVEVIKETQHITHANNLVCIKVTKNFSECLEKLKKLSKYNAALKEKNSNALRSFLGTSPGEKLQCKKITNKIYKFYNPAMRKKLEKFFSMEAKLWQYLASEIGENKESQILNGHEFNISLSESLPKNLYSEIKKIRVATSKADWKLSVLRFMKLLQVHLKFVSQALVKANLNRLHEACFVEDATSIQDSFNYADTLVKQIYENVIPEMERRITLLTSATCFDDSNRNSIVHLAK